MASMLLGLGTDEAQKKTIRQIAKNLKTCGGQFSCLISPKRRIISAGEGARLVQQPLHGRAGAYANNGPIREKPFPLSPCEGGVRGGGFRPKSAGSHGSRTPLYPPFVEGGTFRSPFRAWFTANSTVLPLTPPSQGGEKERNELAMNVEPRQPQLFTAPGVGWRGEKLGLTEPCRELSGLASCCALSRVRRNFPPLAKLVFKQLFVQV
jgi:hypothetical protein